MKHNSDAHIQGNAGNKKSKEEKAPAPAVPYTEDEERVHALMKKIEDAHKCAEHKGKTCYVQDDGSHYHYTNADLTVWATLMVCSRVVLF